MEGKEENDSLKDAIEGLARALSANPLAAECLALAIRYADIEERLRLDRLLPTCETIPTDALFDELLSGALDGDPQAEFDLAYNYLTLCRDESFFDDASHWMESAAKKGHAEAQYWLAYMHRNDLGVYVDFDKMIYWYRKAIDQGHLRAMNNLGDFLRRNEGQKELGEGFLLCDQAARGGLSGAQFCLPFDYKVLKVVNEYDMCWE